MKKDKRLIVTIVARFGSDFQQEVQGNALITMLKVWKDFMESSHKKNNAEVTEEEIE